MNYCWEIAYLGVCHHGLLPPISLKKDYSSLFGFHPLKSTPPFNNSNTLFHDCLLTIENFFLRLLCTEKSFNYFSCSDLSHESNHHQENNFFYIIFKPIWNYKYHYSWIKCIWENANMKLLSKIFDIQSLFSQLGSHPQKVVLSSFQNKFLSLPFLYVKTQSL